MAITNALRKLRRIPGMPAARHAAEVAVTPHVRGELAELRAALERAGHDHQAVIDMITRLSQESADIRTVVARIDQVHPVLLNAMSSVNGIARRSERQLADAARRIAGLEEQLPRIDRLESWIVEHSDDNGKVLAAVEERMAPHVESLDYLLKRVEYVRMEILNELRHSGRHAPEAAHESVSARVVNSDAVTGKPLRLNLGCGHVLEAGMVNVDRRDLPGVDVVAEIDDLPFEPGSVDEIHSAHVLEHFPREYLRRHLLPYWKGLLAPGGTFRAVVPDAAAMARSYADGSISFETFRLVIFGGQEYEGDTHLNGFSADDLTTLLHEAGFEQAAVVAAARVNGECLELEVVARRPRV